MDNDIKIIIEFLARHGAEVEGRSIAEPEAQDAELLTRFAQGGCTAEERAEACDLIRLHPTWLQWLSHRVKALRFNNVTTVTRDGAVHSDS